ncbi:MAG: type IV secretion system DNA-binding domain-containing protein [bacterium]
MILFVAVPLNETDKIVATTTPIENSDNWWVVSLIIFILLIIITVAIVIFFTRKRRLLPRSLNMVTLLIKVPRGRRKPNEQEEEAQKEEKDIVAVSEHMFATLASIRKKENSLHKLFFGKDVISFEIANVGGSIYYFVSAPRTIINFVHDSIVADFQKAEVEIIQDYNMFVPGAKYSGAALKLAKKNYLPFKTYQNMESDPLTNITSAMSRITANEGSALQVVLKEINKSWRRKGMKIAREMQQGKSIGEARKSKFISDFKKTGSNSFKNKNQNNRQMNDYLEEKRLTPMQEETIKLIEGKGNKTAFAANIRILASAETKEKADQNLNDLLSTFNQYDSPEYNNLVRAGAIQKKLLYNFVFRHFNSKHKSILSTEELASLYHFPTKFTETPNIKWLEAKTAPPPENIPSEGTLIGRNKFRGKETNVFIRREDRRRHMYIIGQTGVGKSVLQMNMAIQDIRNGEGVCVVDPHGDLIEGILSNIPDSRKNDVVVFNPADVDRPVGLNMLEYKNEEQKDFVVQEMIAIFYKLFPPEMVGPMFEHNMRNVMLTLMEDTETPGTITEIPRMFTDQEYQKFKLRKVKDPVVRQFWEKEMSQTSDFHKSEMLGYLISKVGRFVENGMMRNIIGQKKSGFDLKDIMDNQKILLVNLSKGKIGEMNSSLLGLIIVSKIQMAAMSRASLPEDQRKDFYLYIDEFQNYTTDSIATILSEARKYRLNLIIAHQYISQLIKDNNDTSIRDAVFGNVGTICAFRIGVDDAEIMAKQFEPVFDDNDVINVDKHHAFVRLMINNTASNAFSMDTFPPYESQDEKCAEDIKNISRLKYGVSRSEVEQDILDRSKFGDQSSRQNFNEPTL